MTASPARDSMNRTTALSDLVYEALDALHAAGIDIENLELDSGFRRKRGADHIWYAADSGIGRAGRPWLMVTAGNARQTGDVSTPLVVYKSWETDREPFSADEAAEIRRQIERAAERRQEQEQQRRQAAAEQARTQWDGAQEEVDRHPYLEAKGVKAHGIRRHGKHLLVPVADAEGNLHGLQSISPAGMKRFNPGAAVGGHFHLIGTPAEALCVSEGYATAATIHEATGQAVAVCFNCGNLEPVATALRQAYPNAELIICADDDYRTDGNPGISKATAAARAVGGKLVIPDFGPERPEGATDFNDMARHLGLEAVREAIINQAGVSGVSVAEAQTRANTEVHPDTCDTHQEDVAYQTAPDPTGEPISRDGTSSPRISGVSGVSGVQPNNDAGSSDTPTGGDGVSRVSGTRESPIPDPSDRPTFRVLDDWTEHNGAKYRPGVWYFATDKDGEPVQTSVCSPLHVEAVTFDAQDNNFGRLLRFKTTLGRWREWAMPMELLSGLGNEVRSELLAMGVEIDPSTKARNLLSTYLQSRAPKRRMRCALQIGWCDGSFVLPDTVIGPAASGVIFQSGERGHDEHTVAGTLDGWRSEIAARAVGNPLSTLGLSSGFTGPMLAPTNSEGGGIHFVGESSTGKTTIIEAACSIWGGPNYRRSWRATANGMEGAAALFNDGLLAVDEISECSPKEVGDIVYVLGNGRGKQRASRTGAARGVVRWRCFILSSGERTIATAMHEGGQRAKAGQTVRLLDIPVARAYGAWDTLHGAANAAAFSDAIKRASVTHHGHAGRAFLERLTRDRRDFCALLEEFKALPVFHADRAEGQDKRAAARFALIALAGELATEYGLTGWPEGAAIEAAATGLELWRSLRGTGNEERRQIPEQVASFIERHGDSRFSCSDSGNSERVYDRAGWWRATEEGREYLFNTDGMHEALKGFDFRHGLDVLQEVGALPPPKADGKRAQPYRIAGRSVRLYPINPDKLGDSHA